MLSVIHGPHQLENQWCIVTHSVKISLCHTITQSKSELAQFIIIVLCQWWQDLQPNQRN